MTAHHLFVYGTLRRGCDNTFAQMLSQHSQCIGEVRLPGRLYDFGRYPGARRADEPSESIMGEVFYLDEPGAVLAALDEYEGPEFERAMVSVTTEIRECWIYWYVGPETGRLIASGDWFQR